MSQTLLEKRLAFRVPVSWVFCLPALVPALVWVAQDHSIWSFDPAWYGEVTVDLWWTLVHETSKWPKALLTAFGSKAPGIAWLGQFFVPLGAALGSVERGLLLSVILCQFLSLFLMMGTISKLFGPDSVMSAFSVLLAASSPLFVGMSHQFFAEPLQMLATTCFFAIAAGAAEWKRNRTLVRLLGAASLGLAAKVSTPLYCILPGLAALWTALGRSGADAGVSLLGSLRRERFFYPAVLLALLTAAWYGKNSEYVFRHAMESASGEVSLAYGRAAPWLEKLSFWGNAASFGLLYPPTLCLFALAAIVVVWRMVRQGISTGRPAGLSRGDWLALLAAAQAAGVLTLFAGSINEETRYLLPLLPAVTLLGAWLVHRAQSRWLRRVALLVVAVQFLWVNAQALGFLPRDSRISPWLLTTVSDGARMAKLQDVVGRTCSPELAGRYQICGVEYPWLNANTLSFYAAQQRLDRGYRCRYTSLGYAESRMEEALRRLYGLKPCYFISLAPEFQTDRADCFNRVSLPVLDALMHSGDFQDQGFPSHFGIVILKHAADSSCSGG